MKTLEQTAWKSVVKSIAARRMSLGKLTTYNLLNKTNHLLFSFARYKFAAKMIGEAKNVLELGCSEGVGTLILAQNRCRVTAIDFDQAAIRWAQKNLQTGTLSFQHDEFLGKQYGTFDAVVALDVIEHISRKNEKRFVETIYRNLTATGVALVGTPNVAAARYASPASKAGHINNFSAERLRTLFERYFRTVFVFGMNDEIVHTGFYPMSHYLMVVACFPKKKVGN